jgi:hypothetical protein
LSLSHSGLAEKEMDVKKYTNKENGRKWGNRDKIRKRETRK